MSESRRIEYGFTMELWGLAPNRYYVDIESHPDRKTGRIQGGIKRAERCNIFIGKNQIDRGILSVDSSAGAPVIVRDFKIQLPGILEHLCQG